jgi:plastocyanin
MMKFKDSAQSAWARNFREGMVWCFHAAVLLFSAQPLPASIVTNVNIGDNFFSPAAVTISVNDKVSWTWTGFASHSSTSSGGLWDSGIRGNGSTFTNTFTSIGNFPYHCSVHAGQLGSITVQAAANVPPAVTITNPLNGAVLAAPATVNLAARASDTDGTVANVQFFQGNSALGIVTASPYTVTIGGLAPGVYTFSAIATDNSGGKNTNAVSVTVVAPVPVVLSSPLQGSALSFQFSYTANPGLRYVVRRSPDFTTWTFLSTNTATGSPMTYLDTSAPGTRAFYSVGRLPNP